MKKDFTHRAEKFTRRPALWVITMSAAGFFGIGSSIQSNDVDAPATAAPVSSPALHDQRLQSLTTEAGRLEKEFSETEFAQTTLEKAQANIAKNDQRKLKADLQDLQESFTSLQERIKKRDNDTAAFHHNLNVSFVLSEQEVRNLYTDGLKGERYADYYNTHMRYRDECRVTLNLPTDGSKVSDAQSDRLMDCISNDEPGKTTMDWGRLGALMGLTGLGLFGLAFNATALRKVSDQNQRRRTQRAEDKQRRDEKLVRDSAQQGVEDIRNMLRRPAKAPPTARPKAKPGNDV